MVQHDFVQPCCNILLQLALWIKCLHVTPLMKLQLRWQYVITILLKRTSQHGSIACRRFGVKSWRNPLSIIHTHTEARACAGTLELGTFFEYLKVPLHCYFYCSPSGGRCNIVFSFIIPYFFFIHPLLFTTASTTISLSFYIYKFKSFWKGGGKRKRDKTVLKAIRKLNSVSLNDGVAVIKVKVLQGMLLKLGIAKNSIFQCHFEVLRILSYVNSYREFRVTVSTKCWNGCNLVCVCVCARASPRNKC